MSKRFLLLLLVTWNFILTGLIIWSLARNRVPDRLLQQRLGNMQLDVAANGEAFSGRSDTAALVHARIAYFMMDSLQQNYELVKESAARVRSEGQRMEGQLQREMQKAQARYAELVNKDHTYSTQAELKADQAEVEKLAEKIQRLQDDAHDQLESMQAKLLTQIAGELKDYLEQYNKTAGFDYIFSIQDAGQIWVGNKGLDITGELVDGLNAKHRAKQADKAK